MAPEVRKGTKVTSKADVWSFGVLLWELLERRAPQEEDLKGVRPCILAGCEPAWKLLMQQCWKAAPGARPSMAQIIEHLQDMLD